ncbi:MAG: type II secretion system protein [Candidatus Omnitrophota bacterium]
MKKRLMSDPGFTLIELTTAAAIVVIALSGLLMLFARLSSMNENANNLTLANIAIQDKMEEIKNFNFDTILATYNNTRFEPDGFAADQADGWIKVNQFSPGLLQVYISVSWRESSNRVIGEDKNLNGQLDGGEDLDSDNLLSSPARLITLIYPR